MSRGTGFWNDRIVNGITEEEYLRLRVVDEGVHPSLIIDTLNDLYGNSRSYNAVRKKLASMGHNISKMELKTAEDIAFEMGKEEVIGQIITEFEQKLRQKDQSHNELKRKYRHALDERNRMDALLEMAHNSIISLGKVPAGSLYDPPQRSHTPETAVALFSDTHWGEVVSSEETYGLNEYNWTIAQRRAAFYIDTITDIVKNRLIGYDLPRLEFWMLGDMLSGIIHQELMATNDLNLMDGVMGGSLVLANMLRELAQVFPEVHCVGVVGNHPRTTNKPAFKEKYVNWDYVLYNIVSLLLQDQKNITWEIPKSFFTIREVYPSQSFLLYHGDGVKSWSGVPWYGIEREINAFTALLASKETYFPYVAMGHFHTASEIDRIAGEYFINGAGIGGNEYSIGRLVKSSPPKQFFFGVHPKKGVSWRYKIRLDYGDKDKSLDRYKYNPDLLLLDQARTLLGK